MINDDLVAGNTTYPLKNDGLPQLGLLLPTEWTVNPNSMVPKHQPVMGLMGPKHHWNMTRSTGQICTGHFDHDPHVGGSFFPVGE